MKLYYAIETLSYQSSNELFSNHFLMQHNCYRRRTSPSNVVDCCIHHNHTLNDIVFIITTSANLQIRGIFYLFCASPHGSHWDFVLSCNWIYIFLVARICCLVTTQIVGIVSIPTWLKFGLVSPFDSIKRIFSFIF